MLSNMPTLAQLDGMTAAEISSLAICDLELLLEELAEMKASAKRRGDLISAELSRRFGEQAADARRKAGKDTGTVKLSYGEYVIDADLPKKVTWDQTKLAEAVATISTWEDDKVSDYVDVEYKVQERKFSAWPGTLKKLFEPARTVGAGAQTFKIGKAS